MKYILIEHPDGRGTPLVRIFNSLADRAHATRVCILGEPTPENKDENCPELLELATNGKVHFEGDPSLEWLDAEISVETKVCTAQQRAAAIVKDVLVNHLPRIQEGLEKGYVDENQILVLYDHAVRARVLTEHTHENEPK